MCVERGSGEGRVCGGVVGRGRGRMDRECSHAGRDNRTDREVCKCDKYKVRVM